MNSSQRKLELLRKAETLALAKNRAAERTTSMVTFTDPKKIIAASRRTISDLAVPVPPGLNYFEFQRAGIEFLASHTVALLADEMGLGKSIQVCGLLNHCSQIRSVLIVCPASL
jgi:SNF2 family DNA or RNA helicase